MRTVTTRAIGGRVNSDGTLAVASPGVTSRKTGTGAYAVTVPSGFRIQSATVNPYNASDAAQVSAVSGDGFSVVTYATSPVTAADRAFTFVAVGVGA